MDLVIHQVVELHDVHHSHGDVGVEDLSGATIEERGLPGCRQVCILEHLADFVLGRSIENRRSRVDPARAAPCGFQHALVIEPVDLPLEVRFVEDLL